jgi:monoamine oxidase
VTGLLEKRLEGLTDLHEKAIQWDLWTNNWSQFSVSSFLRSTLTAIKSQLLFDDIITGDDPLLNELDKYLPFPEMAIICYTAFNYNLGLDLSLITSLTSRMGRWSTADMHSLEGGLSALPIAFATQGEMEQHITYNRTVTKIEYTHTNDFQKSVKVSGIITSSGQPFCVEGRSVIITVPLHVLRGIQIVNSDPSGDPFPKEFQQAIQDVYYTPSTKIHLQYKEQFWNSGSDPSSDIVGGFSRTNLPLGQLHYPTDDKTRPPGKGILMSYTWKSEAILWGALSEEQAMYNLVDQIDQLHPDIDTKALFEMGYRQPWTSDPTTLGAFAALHPREYISIMFLMQNSWKNVYFAGEAISFTNGWIQGALESGLRAAYELYGDDQPISSDIQGQGKSDCSSSSSSSSSN